MRHLGLAIAAGCFLAVPVGCTAPESTPSEGPPGAPSDVGMIGQASSSPSPFNNMWPNQQPIGLCFVRGEPNPAIPGYLSDADLTKLKGWTLSVLGGAWGSVPGVSFFDAGGCSSSTATINLFDSRGGAVGTGGDCGFGVGGSCRFGGNPTLSAPNFAFLRIVIHEVGHLLGMMHEHQRSDHGTLCTGVWNQWQACYRCKTGFETTGVCVVADWNVCVPNDLTGTNVNGSPGSTKYNEALAPFLNNCTVGTPGCTLTERLATVYDPVSVMNYCSADFGGDVTHITDLDRLGLRILYPATPSQHRFACKGGCFELGSTDAVLASQGTLTSDFSALGALGISPTWSYGTWSGTSELFGALSIPTAPLAPLTFSYVDFAGRTHSGSGNVTKADDLFTAILASSQAAVAL